MSYRALQVVQAGSQMARSPSRVGSMLQEVPATLTQPSGKSWTGWLEEIMTSGFLFSDNVDSNYYSQTSDIDAYDVQQYFCGVDHGSILITTSTG